MTVPMKATPAQVDGLLGNIRSASSLVDLTEARARIEAARAWAKVHGQVKEMRLDLLRVEIEALVRIVELGGIDTLPAKDRKAARHLANLTTEERASLVAASGSATTAAGMLRSVWLTEELEQERAANRRMGRALAEAPDLPTDAEVQADVRRTTYAVEDVLGEMVEEFIEAGEEFTTGEFASEVIRRAALGSKAEDPDVEAGIRDVCKEAIRRQPVVKIEGTILPRFVTALSEAGNHVRIPVENALLRHLDQMCEMRREQIAQDQRRLDELEAALRRLRDVPGAKEESRIGDIVASTLIPERASA